ncbi:hypothetical protein OG558_11440 [Kribbella sp. NBC_01510]|uniref:hypothetical protein n=1 Tax=Kribbella sp. NBC_01510 TaxID=2903581 RepID=UPI003867534E
MAAGGPGQVEIEAGQPHAVGLRRRVDPEQVDQFVGLLGLRSGDGVARTWLAAPKARTAASASGVMRVHRVGRNTTTSSRRMVACGN